MCWVLIEKTSWPRSFRKKNQKLKELKTWAKIAIARTLLPLALSSKQSFRLCLLSSSLVYLPIDSEVIASSYQSYKDLH